MKKLGRLTKMNEIKILKRKLVLKRQALGLFIEEVKDIEERLALLKIRQRIEKDMAEPFEPTVSRRLDAVNFLLDEGTGNG